eukprot:gene11482-4646_t
MKVAHNFFASYHGANRCDEIARNSHNLLYKAARDKGIWVKKIDDIYSIINKPNEENKQLVHKFKSGILREEYSENRLKSSPWGNIGCQQWHRFTYGDPGEVFIQKSFGADLILQNGLSLSAMLLKFKVVNFLITHRSEVEKLLNLKNVANRKVSMIQNIRVKRNESYSSNNNCWRNTLKDYNAPDGQNICHAVECYTVANPNEMIGIETYWKLNSHFRSKRTFRYGKKQSNNDPNNVLRIRKMKKIYLEVVKKMFGTMKFKYHYKLEDDVHGALELIDIFMKDIKETVEIDTESFRTAIDESFSIFQMACQKISLH